MGPGIKEHLIKGLKRDNDRSRFMIAVALKRLAPAQPALTEPILQTATLSKDQSIRAIAGMMSTGAAPSKKFDIDTLISMAMKNRRFGAPSPASGQLIQMGKAAVEPLMDVLRGQDGVAAGKAGRILARIGAPALPHLIEAMKSDRVDLRVFAVRALAQMGPPAQAILIQALQDPAYPVRRVARYSLLASRSPEAQKALRNSPRP